MKSIKLAGISIRIGTIFKENDYAFESCKCKPDLLSGPDFYAAVSIDEILREQYAMELPMREAELSILCRQIFDNLSDYNVFLIHADVIQIHKQPFLLFRSSESKNTIPDSGSIRIYAKDYSLIHQYYGRIYVSDFPLLSEKIMYQPELPLRGIILPTNTYHTEEELNNYLLKLIYLPRSYQRIGNALKMLNEIKSKYPLIEAENLDEFDKIYQKAEKYDQKQREQNEIQSRLHHQANAR